MNEKFNKNAKVEKLTNMILGSGEEKGLIVKAPLWTSMKVFGSCRLAMPHLVPSNEIRGMLTRGISIIYNVENIFKNVALYSIFY